MKKLFFLATILLVVFFIPKIVSANVVINEIAWMGTTNSTYDEWIELYNSGEEDVNLFYYQLSWSDKLIAFNNTKTNTKKINNAIIPAKGYFLLERTDDNSVPEQLADIIYTGGLVDDGETLELRDDEGNLVDQINCSEKWSHGNKTTKQTMERTADGWQTSLDPEGTPKAQNSSGATKSDEEPESPSAEATEDKEETTIITGNNPPVPDLGDNIIAFIGQEINFDGTNSTDPDGDDLHYEWNMGDGKLIEEPSFTYTYLYPGTYLVTLMVYDGLYYVSETITVKIQSQEITINEFIPNPEGDDAENEWIEIYNDSDSIVDVSGWQLDDEASGSQPFIFPQNTLIAPKSYLVFARPITKIALNNDKDCVRLLLPGGVVFQEVQYEEPKEGQSSAHTEEGFVWSAPTPGLANITGPEISIGIGGEENQEIVYDYQVEPQITRESTEDYSWYYAEIPEQNIEGGYLAQPSEIEEDKDLAMIEPLLTQKETPSSVKTTESKKNSINLILLLIVVILAALIIGIFITRFRKRIT